MQVLMITVQIDDVKLEELQKVIETIKKAIEKYPEARLNVNLSEMPTPNFGLPSR